MHVCTINQVIISHSYLIDETLCSPRNLKDVETAEKNVLPTADDVKAEKTHQGLIEGVENFSSEKLKSVKTREPASGKDGEKVKFAGYIQPCAHA